MMKSNNRQMSLVESLKALQSVRRENEVVITAMGTAREWMELGAQPLDWIFVPSSMGQATALGLGLALAQPQRKVIVCNGDGSTLLNLGSLVTITAQAPPNLDRLYILFGHGRKRDGPVHHHGLIRSHFSGSFLWQRDRRHEK